MFPKLSPGIALLLGALLMAAAPPTPRADEAASLRAAQVEWGEEWAARAADRIIARYAPDAVLLIPGQEAVTGIEQAARSIRETLADPHMALAWTVDAVRVSASSDMAYLRGRYVQHNPTADGRSYTVETGYYVTTFEKRDGHWLATVEINTPGPLTDTSGLPAAALEVPAP